MSVQLGRSRRSRSSESVFSMPESAFMMPESAFTLLRNPCSRSSGIGDQNRPERARMSGFQVRLERLEAQPTPDSVQRLSQEMEAQRGIDDILNKYREAQQAKES